MTKRWNVVDDLMLEFLVTLDSKLLKICLSTSTNDFVATYIVFIRHHFAMQRQ